MTALNKLSLSSFNVGDRVKSLITNIEGVVEDIFMNDGKDFDNIIAIHWDDDCISELWHCYCENIVLIR